MPKRTLYKGRFYHVYNRGHNKQQIFFKKKDYDRFYSNISRYQEKYPNIQIPVWCILPNHFHFLILEKPNSNPSPGSNSSPGLEQEESARISDFMRKLQQSYAAFFDAHYKESVRHGIKGPVFEGRFKAKPVEDEDYLYHLKRYIEWNAVKHEIVDKPEEWGYSSYAPSMYGPDTYPVDEDEFNPYFE